MPPATTIENTYRVEHFGSTPLEYMETVGRLEPDAWFVHGVDSDDATIARVPDRADEIRSIEPGKVADIVLWDLPTALATQHRRLLDKAR